MADRDRTVVSQERERVLDHAVEQARPVFARHAGEKVTVAALLLRAVLMLRQKLDLVISYVLTRARLELELDPPHANRPLARQVREHAATHAQCECACATRLLDNRPKTLEPLPRVRKVLSPVEEA